MITHNLRHLITDQSSYLWLTASCLAAVCTGGNMEIAPCGAELTDYSVLLFNIIAQKCPSGNINQSDFAH